MIFLVEKCMQKSLKNHQQIDKKSIKNRSNIVQNHFLGPLESRWKIIKKSMKNRSKIVQNRILGPSWGLLRASWKLDHTNLPKSWAFGSLPGGILGPCWTPKKIFYVKNFSKRPPGRARGAIFEVSKNKLNIEGSWSRFSIDFGRVLTPPGLPKMCAPLRREWNFGLFGYLKIS